MWNWINRDGGAPAEVCPDIEAATGVKCEELCPGVRWDVLRNQPNQKSARAKADNRTSFI
jgi:DNA-binding transcriptional regulator YdaS (Cro superfamily)